LQSFTVSQFFGAQNPSEQNNSILHLLCIHFDDALVQPDWFLQVFRNSGLQELTQEEPQYPEDWHLEYLGQSESVLHWVTLLKSICCSFGFGISWFEASVLLPNSPIPFGFSTFAHRY
jgi:hypothetical protein